MRIFQKVCQKLCSYSSPTNNVDEKGSAMDMGPWTANGFRDTWRDNLIYYPTLGYPMFDRVFRITSDASLYGIGETLTQMQPSGIEGIEEEVERVICYTSKHLTENESRWPAVERECYALYHCTKVWNCYLYFRKVYCFTDHRPLQWLNNAKPEEGRLSHGRSDFERMISLSSTRKGSRIKQLTPLAEWARRWHGTSTQLQ